MRTLATLQTLISAVVKGRARAQLLVLVWECLPQDLLRPIPTKQPRMVTGLFMVPGHPSRPLITLAVITLFLHPVQFVLTRRTCLLTLFGFLFLRPLSLFGALKGRLNIRG